MPAPVTYRTDEYTIIGGQPNFVSSDILADSQRYNMDSLPRRIPTVNCY